MKNSRLIIIACLVTMLALGCSNRPKDVLSKEDMAQLLADMHTGESVVEINPRQFESDSIRRAFKQSIYKRHGVTPEQVDSSLSWYGYHMDKYIEVYDRVIEILEKRLAQTQEKAGSQGAVADDINLVFDGDSVDVWSGMRFHRMASNMPSDFLTFTLKNDRTWDQGDVYRFKSKAVGLDGLMQVALVAEYLDGSKSYVNRSFSGDGWHEVKLVTDSARPAQVVYGLVHYHAPNDKIAFLDSISLMRTRWGSHQRTDYNLQKTLERKTRSYNY